MKCDTTRSVALAVLAMLVLAGPAAGQDAADWDQADAQTIRLAPAKVSSLPAAVLNELTRRDCTIPQVAGAKSISNVVIGHFTAKGRRDIAVLCSRNRVSAILVFSGSSAMPVAEFAAAPDKNYLQDLGNGIGFSRSLQVADPQTMRRYQQTLGNPASLAPDHDGIEDAFVEKASVIWHRHEGVWRQLAGSD